MLVYFAYGETETAYLRRKDPRLGAVIDRVGMIERAVDPDLFSSVVHHIIGQQISTKAQETIWRRLQEALGAVNAETVLAAGEAKLQALGMTFRKAAYLTDFAAQVHAGAFDLDAVAQLPDGDAIRQLSSLKGIGAVIGGVDGQVAEETNAAVGSFAAQGGPLAGKEELHPLPEGNLRGQ